jgi:hypothetical protein
MSEFKKIQRIRDGVVYALTPEQIKELQRDSVYHNNRKRDTFGEIEKDTLSGKKFHCDDGFLSLYGLICGYMDSFSCDGFTVTRMLDNNFVIEIVKNKRIVHVEFFERSSESKKYFMNVRKQIMEGKYHA